MAPEGVKMAQPLIAGYVTATLLFSGCDSKDWEAAGYQDGYAATINTTCQFRTSLIHGKWDNEKYARGYARGSGAPGPAPSSSPVCRRGVRQSRRLQVPQVP
jgi:hypothetical protein